jgi:hypothetical protein
MHKFIWKLASMYLQIYVAVKLKGRDNLCYQISFLTDEKVKILMGNNPLWKNIQVRIIIVTLAQVITSIKQSHVINWTSFKRSPVLNGHILHNWTSFKRSFFLVDNFFFVPKQVLKSNFPQVINSGLTPPSIFFITNLTLIMHKFIWKLASMYLQIYFIRGYCPLEFWPFRQSRKKFGNINYLFLLILPRHKFVNLNRGDHLGKCNYNYSYLNVYISFFC